MTATIISNASIEEVINYYNILSYLIINNLIESDTDSNPEEMED